MSALAYIIRTAFAVGDLIRDAGLKKPETIMAYRNLSYTETGDRFNLFDIYYPKGTALKMPVIISIHGGGYVYGDKDAYRFYCMYLAEQGFAVVNMNYHLAPRYKYPVQLTEINMMMEWVAANAEGYLLDIDNVFLVGDSAGAQMNSHYCTIYSNPEFARKLPFDVPKNIKIRATALNCGFYDISLNAKGLFGKNARRGFMSTILKDYLGTNRETIDDQVKVLENITSDFPPAYIMTSRYDFLKGNAEPMQQLLESRGVIALYRLFGEPGQAELRHVFHLNIKIPEARRCSLEQCTFFRGLMQQSPMPAALKQSD